MYKIAVVGDYDSIYGFAALGLEIFPVANRRETEERLAALADSGYGIVYITEAAAAECGQIIEKFQEDCCPLLSGFPVYSEIQATECRE